MKIIHTSDWHIGHVLYNYDRSDEHQVFFDSLTETIREEKPDVLIVSGDVFHTGSPSTAAQKQYIENMLRLHGTCPEMEIVVIAGNHDSGARLEVDKTLWSHFSLHARGSISRLSESGVPDLERYIIPIGNPLKGYVIAVPHCYPQNFPALEADMPRESRPQAFFKALTDKVKDMNRDNLPVVMTSHATVTGSDPRKQDIIIGGLDNLKLEEIGDGYDYLALGHIHFPQTIGHKAAYSGSVIPVSFNEDYPHSINIVKLSSHGAAPEITTRKLPLLREVMTLPQDAPVPFEEALKLLEDFPSDKEAYIRLNVSVRQYGGADWTSRAAEAAKGKRCRYCCILLHSEESGLKDESATSFSQEEMMEKNPMDIARIHFRESIGHEMDEDLSAMMESVVEEILKEEGKA